MSIDDFAIAPTRVTRRAPDARAPARLDAPLAAPTITGNRIGPAAYRRQDVLRAANGVTIQVVHTDAEGRFVPADTLTTRMSGLLANATALLPGTAVLDQAGAAR